MQCVAIHLKNNSYIVVIGKNGETSPVLGHLGSSFVCQYDEREIFSRMISLQIFTYTYRFY